MHPESRLWVHEQNEMFHEYGWVFFENFIVLNQIEIQSSRSLRNGALVTNSPQSIMEVWDRHLRRLLDHSDINLAQMLKSYHDHSTTMSQKRDIYFRLKSIGLEWLDPTNALEHEALMLGMIMLLSEGPEADLSLILTFEYWNTIEEVVETEKAGKKKVA